MPYAFTITEAHREAQHRALSGDPSNGHRDPLLREVGICRAVLGQILSIDVGKRVYRVGLIHQVESAEQMNRRLNHDQCR